MHVLPYQVMWPITTVSYVPGGKVLVPKDFTALTEKGTISATK